MLLLEKKKIFFKFFLIFFALKTNFITLDQDPALYPDPNWAKIRDPDQNCDPQLCLIPVLDNMVPLFYYKITLFSI